MDKLLGQNSLSLCQQFNLDASVVGYERPTSDLLHDLHDVLVVEDVLDADTLRLMLNGRSPYQATVEIKTKSITYGATKER